MEINKDQNPPTIGLTSPVPRQQQPQQSFATMLDSERLKNENAAAAKDVLANQQSSPDQPNKEAIDYIREHGMSAFAEEVHKKKMEELRAKILEAMGLDEETLAEMPADQRREIEKLIAMEVQKRLAADSLHNGSSANNEVDNSQAAIGNIGPTNQLAAQVLAGDPGSLIGMVISQETDPLTSPEGRKTDDTSG